MRKCLWLLLLTTGWACDAQVLMNRDSLLNLVATAKEDSNAVLLFINIGQQYESNEPETAKQYYRRANLLSKKIGYTLGEIKFVFNYGFVLNMQGHYDSSLQLNLGALTLARQFGDSLVLGKALFNTATSYRLGGDYERAVEYYERGKKLFDKYGDDGVRAQSNDILSTLYHELHQYDRAVAAGEESVKILRALNNMDWLGSSLNNLGLNYIELRQFDKAMPCFTEALAITKKNGDKNLEATLQLNIGNLLFQQNQFDAMKVHFENAHKLAEELELYETLVIAKKGLAYYYEYQKNYTLAEAYAHDALKLTYAYDLRAERAAAFEQLSSIAFSRQDMEQGLAYSMQSNALSDSLLNETTQKNIADLEVKYETSRKDNELRLKEEEIKRKTVSNYMLIVCAVAIVIVSLLSYRNYRHKQALQQQRIHELEAEKQLTAAQAVLRGEEQERTRLAKDLHDGLGGMLSGIKYSLHTMKENLIMTPENALAFERSIDMLDSSIQEMRRVAHNMMPEALVKFGLDSALRDFCHNINQSGVLKVQYQSIGLDESTVSQTTAITVYRIVQELLNNSMKHASARVAVVQISKEDNEISLTVEDDGKGFDPAQLRQAKGMGWQNIESRIAYLKGRLDIQSAPGKGTSVLIEFTNV